MQKSVMKTSVSNIGNVLAEFGSESKTHSFKIEKIANNVRDDLYVYSWVNTLSFIVQETIRAN